MLIYLPALSSRCRYTLEWVFEEVWGIKLSFTTAKNSFESFEGEKLCYDSTSSFPGLFIAATNLLFAGDIKPQNVKVFPYRDTIAIFPTEVPGAALPFDVFAAIFYMISRYEEYLETETDNHGRYPSHKSLAFKHDFLSTPVVNYWLKYLKQAIQQHYPGLAFKDPPFRAILTYDIDTAYAFLGRNFPRMLGSMAKDLLSLNLLRLKQRMQVMRGKSKDPSDTYDYLLQSQGLEKIFFILAGPYGPRDKNISADHPLMKGLITRLAREARIGIHPSYRSGSRPAAIRAEISRLESVSGIPVTLSRQHYLRYRVPRTYRALLDAGIREEYSLGYADLPGFRAGTCLPFYCYDLEKEKKTELKIFPVTFMEGTLKDYMNLDPPQAWKLISQLIDEVKQAGGVFISLWHNDTLTDTGKWKGWKTLHDQMIHQIQFSQ